MPAASNHCSRAAAKAAKAAVVHGIGLLGSELPVAEAEAAQQACELHAVEPPANDDRQICICSLLLLLTGTAHAERDVCTNGNALLKCDGAEHARRLHIIELHQNEMKH
jgi:hypothetical protein